ncbi:MAG TPA: hypothetical protein VEV83_00570 [Parafilimonas sp.]|nr:hypothetical protein [Parafilimonas sp.]
MKQELNSSKVYLEQEELDRLCIEVKEVVATDIAIQPASKQAFGLADLWNIQRMRKEHQRRPTLWN